MMKKHSVDSVLKTISSSIDKLEEVHNNNINEADRLNEQIETLNTKKDVAENEAERAHRVKDRLRELLS